MKYRVTKYNPLNRDEWGVYLNQNEWTSYSDIGEKKGDEPILTLEEYLRIENSYIDAVLKFIKMSNINSLYVFKINKWEESVEDFDEITTEEMKNLFASIKVGKEVTLNDVRPLVQLILRELIWVELGVENKVNIEFGYDYYMYFKTDLDISYLKRRIENNRLFVELMPPESFDVEEE